MTLPNPSTTLPNLGPTSVSWLRNAGIRTIIDLERFGPVAAYRLVKNRQPSGLTINLLWALEAGLLGKDWRELSEEDKSRLKTELEEG